MSWPNVGWAPDEHTTLVALVAGALVAVWLFARICAWGFVRYRSRPFMDSAERAAELDRLRALAGEYNLQALLARIQTSKTFEDGENYVDGENKAAGLLQIRYHGQVARSISAIAFALLLLVLSITVIKNEQFKLFATAADMIAIAYALVFYARARYTNRKWVRRRSLSELLRSWVHLAIVYPLDSGNSNGKTMVVSEAATVQKDVTGKGTIDSLHRNIDQYWMGLRRRCEEAGLKKPLREEDLALYVGERPLFQLSYFIGAQRRLFHFQKHQERYMLALFVLSVILALWKTAIVFTGYLPADLIWDLDIAPPTTLEWIAAALLAALIASATLTSMFVSRNDRSLVHRYRGQERRVGSWLAEFQSLYGGAAGLAAQEEAIGRSILDFEAMMIEELLDWVHITSRDVIEIGS